MINNIYKITFAALCICIAPDMNAQFTEGGAPKTAKTDVYKPVKQSYTYFSFGILAHTNSIFTEVPTANISIPIQENYQSRDGMGGNIGGSISMGAFHAFKSLNNKIHPIIDIGIGQNHTIAIHSYNWKNINSYYATQVKYRPFVSLDNSLAPMVSINPLWKKGKPLRIELGYKLGASVVFGGGQKDPDSDYEISRDNFYMPQFFHGPTFRFRYSVLMVGFDMNFLKDNLDDAYAFTNDGINTTYFNSKLNLNNFMFSIGFAY